MNTHYCYGCILKQLTPKNPNCGFNRLSTAKKVRKLPETDKVNEILSVYIPKLKRTNTLLCLLI